MGEFIELTDMSNGESKRLVRVSQIAVVMENDSTWYGDPTSSILLCGQDNHFAVKESYQTVLQMIKEKESHGEHCNCQES